MFGGINGNGPSCHGGAAACNTALMDVRIDTLPCDCIPLLRQDLHEVIVAVVLGTLPRRDGGPSSANWSKGCTLY